METVYQAASPIFLARTRTIQWCCLVAPLERGHTPFLLLPPPPTSPTTDSQTSSLATTHAGRLSAVFVRRRPLRNINNNHININKPNLTDSCSHTTISTTITSPAGAQAQAVDRRHTSPTPRCRGPTIHLHHPKLSQLRRLQLQLRLSQPRQPRPTLIPAP